MIDAQQDIEIEVKQRHETSIVAFFLSLLGALLVVSLFRSIFESNFREINTNAPWFVAITGIILFSVFFGVWLIFACRHAKFGRELLREFDIKPVPVREGLLLTLLGFVFIVAFLLVQEGSIRLFSLAGYSASIGIDEMSNFGEYILVMIGLAVMPAIVEELIFRGMIQRGLMKYGAVAAILGSALLFSLFHMSPAQTVFQFIMGVGFAWIYIRTKNLMYPIILHFVNNATIITYTYITQSVGLEDSSAVFGATTSIAMVLLAVTGAFLVIRLIGLLKEGKEGRITGQMTERKPFMSMENFGFFVCAIISITLWVAIAFA